MERAASDRLVAESACRREGRLVPGFILNSTLHSPTPCILRLEAGDVELSGSGNIATTPMPSFALEMRFVVLENREGDNLA